MTREPVHQEELFAGDDHAGDDSDDAPVVTAVRDEPPAPDGIAHVAIITTDGPPLTLSRREAERLELAPGIMLTAELRAHVADASARDGARRDAARRLARHPIPRARLEDTLARRGYRADLIQEVLDEFQELGALDDVGLAERTAQALVRRSPMAGPLLEARLSGKGLETSAARHAAEAHASNDPLGYARTLLPEAGDVRDAQRIARTLARRGFDEESVRDTIETLAAEGRLDLGDEAGGEFP